MADMDVIIHRLDAMQDTLKDHGETLKLLADTSTAMQLQQQSITYLTSQCVEIWSKLDALTGTEGVISKIRDYQSHCPKDEMHRTFNWMWGAVGFELVLIGWIIFRGV
jgi:hypothetical protein